MKSLGDIGLRNEKGALELKSSLIGFGIEYAYCLKDTSKPIIIEQLCELTMSYFNLRRLAYTAYEKAVSYQGQLSSLSKTSDFYQYHATEHQIGENMQSFITNAKTSIDLLVCICELIVTKTFKEEYQLTDISKIVSQKSAIHQDLKTLISDFKEALWFKELEVTRNRIIHRGFTIEIDYKDAEDVKSEAIKQAMKTLPASKWSEISEKTYEPVTAFYVSKSSLKERTHNRKEIGGGLFDNGFGKIQAKVDTDLIITKYVNDTMQLESDLIQTLFNLNLCPEITDFSEVKVDFGGAGFGFFQHRRFGSF